MTGYLQRLAVTAVRSSPRIHPVVGSIFSQPRQEAKAPAPWQDDLLAPSEDRYRVPVETSVRMAQDDPALRRDAGAKNSGDRHGLDATPAEPRRLGPSRRDERRDASGPDARRSEQQAPPFDAFDSRFPPTGGEAQNRATLDAQEAQPAAAGPESDAPGERAASAAGPARLVVKEPPMSEPRREAAPPGREFEPRPSALAALAGGPDKMARAEISVPTRPPGRSPDDIQIHIGRIEVIAAPPAAPAPPPAPARKTMTLEDYLRRGTGGAR